MFKGIDVSHNNGVIDWRKVKESGIDFAIIRAGYGWAASQVDKQWKNNITNALRYGIDCGSYWFSYATNISEAKAEAALFLKTIEPYKLTYPIAYDYEYDSVEYAKKRVIEITPKLACEIADAFMSACAAAGYYIVNYTNNDYLVRYYTYPRLKNYEVWLAKWTRTKPVNVTGLWQNEVRGSQADIDARPQRATVLGSVPGIKGAIDMDISYKDYPSIIRAANLNRLASKPITVPAIIAQPPKQTFKDKDIVKVLKPVIYGTGKRFTTWFRDYDVIGTPKGDRVVIGKKGSITAAVAAENLEKIYGG